MYIELFLKQETTIYHKSKLSFHMFIVGDINRGCKMWKSNNIPLRTINTTIIIHDMCFFQNFS